MQHYSTEEAARLVGVHRLTLHRWLRDRKVRPSHSMAMSGRTLWRWTKRDVERLKKYKTVHYGKHTRRKKKR